MLGRDRARRGEAPRGGAGGRPALRLRRGLRERIRRRRRRPREPSPRAGVREPPSRGLADPAEHLLEDAAARGYLRGYDDRTRGAGSEEAAVPRNEVDYVREATAIGERAQAALRYAPRADAPARTAADARRFRRDLLYHVEVVRVGAPRSASGARTSPASRSTTWRDVSAAAGSRARLAPGRAAALRAHRWPGNVRALQNARCRTCSRTSPSPRRATARWSSRTSPPPSGARPRPPPDARRGSARTWSGRWCGTPSTALQRGRRRRRAGASRARACRGMMARLEIDRAGPGRERSGGGRSR